MEISVTPRKNNTPQLEIKGDYGNTYILNVRVNDDGKKDYYFEHNDLKLFMNNQEVEISIREAGYCPGCWGEICQ